MLSFFVQTLTGLVLSCEIIELNVPHLYQTVWNALPHELRQEIKPWQIQLLTLEGQAKEEALLEVVRQGGILYLFVHTDHRMDTFIQQMPFDFQCSAHPGVTFVRRVFKACYHTGEIDLSWKVEAYVGLGQEGLLLYHMEDVDRETGWARRFFPVSTDVTVTSVLELIYRAYHHQFMDWQNTPYHLLPALHHAWEQLLLQEIGA
jgi:hypothetical protein